MDATGYQSAAMIGEKSATSFEDLYLEVREMEKRVLTDEQVLLLPDIGAADIYFKEWQLRKRSSRRLINYITKKNRSLRILEIGCGNGWLSSNLSAISATQVIGLDINPVEIAQAKRVFKKDNLEFVCEEFNRETFGRKEFDIILLAASISYFSAIHDVLQNSLDCLSIEGEIHIMDSHFYKQEEVADARARCQNYYSALGYPEMAACYFHRTLNDLHPFNYKILANPRSLISRINKRDPFYWITISH